ncbi:UNKNOWN [Stylonychia lemnae]|uniref:Uncharacterized protein n=1 Tax=Stylonychia lemnae TaxID=5949 RepID=A0A078AKP3_STYLE|nr:UNKNOWN [Stylonychia lemnae]|eukprot:CDW82017.1 UNKNOWN [Stylonychia lemnae]
MYGYFRVLNSFICQVLSGREKLTDKINELNLFTHKLAQLGKNLFELEGKNFKFLKNIHASYHDVNSPALIKKKNMLRHEQVNTRILRRDKDSIMTELRLTSNFSLDSPHMKRRSIKKQSKSIDNLQITDSDNKSFEDSSSSSSKQTPKRELTGQRTSKIDYFKSKEFSINHNTQMFDSNINAIINAEYDQKLSIIEENIRGEDTTSGKLRIPYNQNKSKFIVVKNNFSSFTFAGLLENNSSSNILQETENNQVNTNELFSTNEQQAPKRQSTNDSASVKSNQKSSSNIVNSRTSSSFIPTTFSRIRNFNGLSGQKSTTLERTEDSSQSYAKKTLRGISTFKKLEELNQKSLENDEEQKYDSNKNPASWYRGRQMNDYTNIVTKSQEISSSEEDQNVMNLQDLIMPQRDRNKLKSIKINNL